MGHRTAGLEGSAAAPSPGMLVLPENVRIAPPASERKDSNLRLPPPKGGALTKLSYVPFLCGPVGNRTRNSCVQDRCDPRCHHKPVQPRPPALALGRAGAGSIAAGAGPPPWGFHCGVINNLFRPLVREIARVVGIEPT